MEEKILSGDIGDIGGSSEVRRGMRIVRRKGEPTEISRVRLPVEGGFGETSQEEEDVDWTDRKDELLAGFLELYARELPTCGDIDKQATVLRDEFNSWMRDPGWECKQPPFEFDDLVSVARSEFARLRREIIGEKTGDLQQRIQAERSRFEKLPLWANLLAVLETAQKAATPRRSMLKEPDCDDVPSVKPEPTSIEPYLLRAERKRSKQG